MEEKFIEVIQEALELEERTPEMQDKFKEFDTWDSIAQLTLIAELDDKFGVTIRTEEFKKIETLQDLFDIIQAKQA